jgi:hypothetical protein
MRRILVSLVFLAGAASAAHAGGNEVSVSASNRALRSPSADALTGDGLGGGAMAFARDLGSFLVPRLRVWARAGIAWGDVQGDMFQTMGTDVSTFELAVGARARYELVRRLSATARVDLGAAHTSLTLTPESSDPLTSARWEPVTTAAIGLDVLAIATPRFGLGVRAELGYVEAAAAPMSLKTENGDDGTLRLPATMASFGHLDVSGPTFAFGVYTQF